MDIEDARYLVSRAGREALASAPPEVADMPLGRMVEWFRARYRPREATALSLQVSLRAQARGRQGGAQGLLLTPEGSQMMTHHLVAERRAARVAELGMGVVVDLTCGLGGDLRALAVAASSAVGVERERVTAMLAAANVPGAAVVQGEAAKAPVRLAASFVFVDPSRRTASRRVMRAADYSPPLDIAAGLARQGMAGCVKAAPGIPDEMVPADAELEVVEVGSSLREAALWFRGDARTGLRRAALLPVGAELDSDAPECEADPVALRRYLIDPKSCVTRAGLVRHLGARIGGRLVDPHLGYLTSDEAVADPLGEVFEVLEVIPFSVKRVREVMRARGWRAAEVRRRAFPVEPQEFERLVGLGGVEGTPVALFLTTISGRRTVVVGRPGGGSAHRRRQ